MQPNYSMCTFLKRFFFSFFPILMLASCSKTDSQAPSAAIAPANEIHSIGPVNNRGSFIYYGSGSPDAATGCLGDYYLNIPQGLLTGPKTNLGWGKIQALTGSGGAESQISSGTVTPTAAFGNTGDYYVNTSTFMLYGAKSANGWGVPFNLLTGTETSN